MAAFYDLTLPNGFLTAQNEHWNPLASMAAVYELMLSNEFLIAQNEH
jgi:hypothetical protein